MTFFINSNIYRQDFIFQSKNFLNAENANLADFHRIYSLYYNYSSEVDDKFICNKLGMTHGTFKNITIYTISIKQYKRIVKIMVGLLR